MGSCFCYLNLLPPAIDREQVVMKEYGIFANI
jgi:hypothetical protein